MAGKRSRPNPLDPKALGILKGLSRKSLERGVGQSPASMCGAEPRIYVWGQSPASMCVGRAPHLLFLGIQHGLRRAENADTSAFIGQTALEKGGVGGAERTVG